MLIERRMIADERGSLARMFCAEELAAAGWTGPVAQVNWVETRLRGTLRGMHYQAAPFAEMKLVSCLRGEILDVAVDIRKGSPTFLEHAAVRLSAANRQALLIPEGFAHGYQSLTGDAGLLYLHSASHAPGAERGLNPFDRMLSIDWPLKAAGISERDRSHAFLDAGFEGEDL